MMASPTRSLIIAFVLGVAVLAGCGTVEPQSEVIVVVEAFPATASSEIDVIVRHSETVWGEMAADNAVDDAEVVLRIDGVEVPALAMGEGQYRATLQDALDAGMAVDATIRWKEQRASASTAMPRMIEIDSVRILPAMRPVEAVLIDSVTIGAPPPETGWLYLVDVAVFWRPDATDNEAFIRAKLAPERSFAGPVVDFFLRSDHIFSEASALQIGDARHWNGVYAVRVEGPDSPLPDHEVAIALLRSGRDYARYASSRFAPDRREPVGNVRGGIGIVSGVAVDSLRVVVTHPEEMR